MVKGVAALGRRKNRIIAAAADAARKSLEKEAGRMVAAMNTLKPLPNIVIDWTWGAAPGGAVTLGEVKQSKNATTLVITIYATAFTDEYPLSSGGFPAIARWFEFGTSQRTQKKTGRQTGALPASPFFWPAYRSEREGLKRRQAYAIRSAMKRVWDQS